MLAFLMTFQQFICCLSSEIDLDELLSNLVRWALDLFCTVTLFKWRNMRLFYSARLNFISKKCCHFLVIFALSSNKLDRSDSPFVVVEAVNRM